MSKRNLLHDKVFTVDNVLTPEECDDYIAWATSAGFEAAPVNTADGPVLNEDFRNNTRAIIDDVSKADALFGQCKKHLPANIDHWRLQGLNERFRFYRYEVDQQFDWHTDGSFIREPGHASLVTFMIYLNHDFEGGHTTVMDFDIKPATGKMLCFYHRLLHKGQPVTKGVKYVLRSDIMYRYQKP